MFYWRIDNQGNVFIRRKFKSQKNYLEEKLSFDDINKLDKYMADGEWKALANNVAKLGAGTEKPGIGKFLHEQLDMSTTSSQLSSHLGTIFANSGAWLFNSKKKNMKFKKSDNEWLKKIYDYYENNKHREKNVK